MKRKRKYLFDITDYKRFFFLFLYKLQITFAANEYLYIYPPNF